MIYPTKYSQSKTAGFEHWVWQVSAKPRQVTLNRLVLMKAIQRTWPFCVVCISYRMPENADFCIFQLSKTVFTLFLIWRQYYSIKNLVMTFCRIGLVRGNISDFSHCLCPHHKAADSSIPVHKFCQKNCHQQKHVAISSSKLLSLLLYKYKINQITCLCVICYIWLVHCSVLTVTICRNHICEQSIL